MSREFSCSSRWLSLDSGVYEAALALSLLKIGGYYGFSLPL